VFSIWFIAAWLCLRLRWTSSPWAKQYGAYGLICPQQPLCLTNDGRQSSNSDVGGLTATLLDSWTAADVDHTSRRLRQIPRQQVEDPLLLELRANGPGR
jgi:hypothetical protein